MDLEVDDYIPCGCRLNSQILHETIRFLNKEIFRPRTANKAPPCTSPSAAAEVMYKVSKAGPPNVQEVVFFAETFKVANCSPVSCWINYRVTNFARKLENDIAK